MDGELDEELNGCKVKQAVNNTPPTLISSDGSDIGFSLHLAKQKKLISQANSIVVEFEGGMGDQIMEAEAVIDAMKFYPDKIFTIYCDEQYRQILERIVGIPSIICPGVSPRRNVFDLRISNHTPYINDPRGGYYGKACLYGSHIGLDIVKHKANIVLNDQDLETVDLIIKKFNIEILKDIYGIGIRSGSGWGKCWNKEPALGLARNIRDQLDGAVLLFGQKNEWLHEERGMTDLGGRTSWWETTLLLSQVKTTICVDSGLMHIARALDIPKVTLWGGTNAQVILGQDDSPFDVRLKLDCFDWICYDCRLKNNNCMKLITPQMVLDKILLIHGE